MSAVLTDRDVRALQEEIEGYAHEYGLDFYPVVYQMVDWDQMNEIAAYGGFPTRYPHWTFGMEYERLAKSYAYGLSKIYEMVINTNPVYAYLLECNAIVDQKLVIAHVCGHADFFKHNVYFSHTNRKMMDEIANHGMRVRRYMAKYGQEEVENFIDACMSIEDLIDIHSTAIKRREDSNGSVLKGEEESVPMIGKLQAKDYMDSYINPKEFIEEQKRKLDEERKRKRKFPEHPEKDVLLFLIENAPLQNWQRDTLDVVREEAYYFTPQGQTKVMNEGWASFWHSTIMTQKAMHPSELIDYAEHHSGTMGRRPGRINPYKLGLELLRDIEERWNKGQFGKEWEECDDIVTKKNWDKKLGLGRQKVFEVRKIHNDITFIDTFLTPEFVAEQKLFAYEFNSYTEAYEIASREFNKIKQKLLFSLTNFGKPFIYAVDGNYENRGELYLKHNYEGIDLKIREARDTLKNVYKIWQRPVHLETVVDGWNILLSFNGSEHQDTQLKSAE